MSWSGSGWRDFVDCRHYGVEAAMTVRIARLELRASDLRREAARTKDADAARRMLAIALLLEGHGREQAARQSGMERSKPCGTGFTATMPRVSPACSTARMAVAPRKLTAAQEAEIAAWVQSGPVPEMDGVVRWRLSDPCICTNAASASYCIDLAFDTSRVRPRHPQADISAQQAHKKTDSPVETVGGSG